MIQLRARVCTLCPVQRLVYSACYSTPVGESIKPCLFRKLLYASQPINQVMDLALTPPIPHLFQQAGLVGIEHIDNGAQLIDGVEGSIVALIAFGLVEDD